MPKKTDEEKKREKFIQPSDSVRVNPPKKGKDAQ